MNRKVQLAVFYASGRSQHQLSRQKYLNCHPIGVMADKNKMMFALSSLFDPGGKGTGLPHMLHA